MPASPASTFAQPVSVHPGSPTRSMSASSIATELSRAPGDRPLDIVQDGTNVLMHPTPQMGAVPSVAGLHSAPVPGSMPLWTPPETPLSGASGGPAPDVFAPRSSAATTAATDHAWKTHSASSSVSGVAGAGFAVRRDSDASERPDLLLALGEAGGGVAALLPQATKRDGEDQAAERAPKRRRVAPTQINPLAESPVESTAGSMDPPSVPPSAEP